MLLSTWNIDVLKTDLGEVTETEARLTLPIFYFLSLVVGKFII